MLGMEPHARRVIAVMQNVHAVRDRSREERPGQAMCTNRGVAHARLPVPFASCAARPNPTRLGLVDLRHKAGEEFWIGSRQWRREFDRDARAVDVAVVLLAPDTIDEWDIAGPRRRARLAVAPRVFAVKVLVAFVGLEVGEDVHGKSPTRYSTPAITTSATSATASRNQPASPARSEAVREASPRGALIADASALSSAANTRAPR